MFRVKIKVFKTGVDSRGITIPKWFVNQFKELEGEIVKLDQKNDKLVIEIKGIGPVEEGG